MCAAEEPQAVVRQLKEAIGPRPSQGCDFRDAGVRLAPV